MKTAILVFYIFCFGMYSQAYCQEINAKQSLKNAKMAWTSIFPGNRCVLLHESNLLYVTNVYEMKSFKSEIVKTNSRIKPFKLKVRIVVDRWTSRTKKKRINEALDNVDEKGDGYSGPIIEEFPLTALYEIQNDSWVFTMGNKLMIDFLSSGRAKYNTHVNILKIISIPEN